MQPPRSRFNLKSEEVSNMKTVSTWFVPSANTPGEYYEVKLYPNGGTSCPCQWGASDQTTTKCWHAKFVQVIECQQVQNEVGDFTLALAARGDVCAQLLLLQTCGSLLARGGRFFAAHRCYEMIAKYMQAVSVQGAAPSHTHPKTEAVRVAASSPSLTCPQCAGRGTVLALDGEGCLSDDYHETCPICLGLGVLSTVAATQLATR